VLELNQAAGSMLKMLRRLIGENINLVWRPKAGPCPVKMNPVQVDQILANLCVNARDAITDVGKIKIETGNAVFDETYCADHFGYVMGDYVLLAISDNGCGMDKETLGQIFEPFFTSKKAGWGTGVGLSMVHGIVKQNNGFINVYSEPGGRNDF
jgi:two-component system, cell cycle sensor histidine kinase and response regulator CckA